MLLSLAASILLFSGGTDSELVDSLAEWTQVPVALLASDNSRWPSAEIKAEDPKDRRRLLGTKLRLDVRPATFGVAPAAMPSLLINQSTWPYYIKATSFPERSAKSSVSGGRITFLTSGTPVTLERALAPTGGLSRPVTVHWMFEPVAVHISAKNALESRYIQTLADAVGAKIIETKTSYHFDFDPAAYRRRVSNRIRADLLTLPEGHARADRLFDVAVLESLSDRDLSGLFKDRNRNRDVWFPATGGVLAAATNRLTWIFGTEKRPARSVADQQLAHRYGGVFNWERPSGVTWQIHGTASSLYIGTKDGKPLHLVL